MEEEISEKKQKKRWKKWLKYSVSTPFSRQV